MLRMGNKFEFNMVKSPNLQNEFGPTLSCENNSILPTLLEEEISKNFHALFLKIRKFITSVKSKGRLPFNTSSARRRGNVLLCNKDDLVAF